MGELSNAVHTKEVDESGKVTWFTEILFKDFQICHTPTHSTTGANDFYVDITFKVDISD